MAASGEKPYRVYKGGRTKGKVPLQNRDRAERDKPERTTYRSGGGDGGGGGREVVRRPKSRWTWKRWTWVTLLSLFILLVIWSVAGYLSVSSGVSAANKRLPAGDGVGPREAELAVDLLGHEHLAARHRPLDKRPSRTKHRPALGLDDAAAHRSEPTPSRLPLDPARPARIDPGLRRAEGERCDADRRAEARNPHRRPALRSRSTGQPRGRRRHGVVRDAHRRGRRRRHQCPREHPLRQVRLSVLGVALLELARLALPQGRPAHERTPRTDLRPHPREPAQPGRLRHQPGCTSAASDAGRNEQARERGHVPAPPVQRRRSDETALDRPFDRCNSCSSAGSSSAPARPCTAGLAGEVSATASSPATRRTSP